MPPQAVDRIAEAEAAHGETLGVLQVVGRQRDVLAKAFRAWRLLAVGTWVVFATHCAFH